MRFDCGHKCQDHHPVHCDTLRTGDGTQNLIYSAKACDRRRGILVPSARNSDPNRQEYSFARHRAILAIRCARDCCSFESVVDDLHQEEVQLLRPGTALPCAATISNDVKRIYQDSSVGVARYFKVFIHHLIYYNYVVDLDTSHIASSWHDSPGS